MARRLLFGIAVIVACAAGFPGRPAAQGSGRTDADRYIARLNGANGAPDPTFNGGKPFAYNSAGVIGDNARRSVGEADGFDQVPDVPDSCWTIRSISRNGSVRINIAKHLQLVAAETANALQRVSVVACHRNDDK